MTMTYSKNKTENRNKNSSHSSQKYIFFNQAESFLLRGFAGLIVLEFKVWGPDFYRTLEVSRD